MGTYKEKMSLSISKFAPSTNLLKQPSRENEDLHADNNFEGEPPKLIEESTSEKISTPTKKDTALSKKRKTYSKNNTSDAPKE